MAGLATAVGAGFMVALAARPSIWESWRPATCMPDHCFCEAIRAQLVKQPANSVSGLAFVGVAILVLLSTSAATDRALSAGHNLIRSHAVYPSLYALAAIVVGLGTTFYHASLTFWGQTADVLGMYLVATFLVLYNVSRVRRLSPVSTALLYVGGNTVLLAGLVLMPAARRYVFGALILLALGLELAARRAETGTTTDARRFQLAVGFLGFGFLIWILDITRTVCSPNSWLQGHAVWHVAGAAALWLIFLYYRSATPTRAQ